MQHNNYLEIHMEQKNVRLKIVERFRTQEIFSAKSGINEAIVSKIVRGIRQPTEEQKKIFERLLNTPAKELFDNK